MIDDKEDCCDNCEEGIEPCCDEELAAHIEEQLDEQSTPEPQPQFVPEEKAKNRLAEELAKHLCCQTKFYIIQRAMEPLSEKELKKLRDDLRKYTKTGVLHHSLESKFRHALAKFN